MKTKAKHLAVVDTASIASIVPVVPTTREAKLAAAKEFLGERWSHHKNYKPRVKVGSFLTAWASKHGPEARKGMTP